MLYTVFFIFMFCFFFSPAFFTFSTCPALYLTSVSYAKLCTAHVRTHHFDQDIKTT